MPTERNIIYTITLSDGTKLPRLTLNGNNFVSQEEITEDIFVGRMSEVIISSERGRLVLHNARLIAIHTYPDDPNLPGWYFVIEETPKEELERQRMLANIQYLAMMTDTDL